MIALGSLLLIGLVSYTSYYIGYDKGYIDGVIAEMTKNRKEKMVQDMQWQKYKKKVLLSNK